jgi:hypothetical protein
MTPGDGVRGSFFEPLTPSPKAHFYANIAKAFVKSFMGRGLEK